MNNNSSHGVPASKQKNITKKKKTSNKNVTKVVLKNGNQKQRPQMKSDRFLAQLKEALYRDVMHLQEPKEAFLIPRLSGAPRVPHLFYATYNPVGLANQTGAVYIRPQMRDTVTEYVVGTTPVPVPANKIRAVIFPQVSEIAANTNFTSFDPIVCHPNAGSRRSIPGVFNHAANSLTYREQDRVLTEGVTYYPILLTTTAAVTFTFKILPTPGTQPFTGTARIADYNNNVIGSTTFNFTGPLLNVSVVAPIGAASNLIFSISSSVALTDQTLAFSVQFPPPSTTWTLTSSIYNLSYDMAGLMQSQAVADDYQASSTSSVTGLWTLLQNQTAELYKQGRIGHCQLPSSSERYFPSIPDGMLQAMANLPSLSQPNLPLATGGQRSYLFEDAEQLAFKNWKIVDMLSETNPLPTIAYAWNKGQADLPTPLQLTLNIRLNVEYFTTSPVAPAFTPPPFCFNLYQAVNLAMLESECGEDMGGENPKHVDRMKRIARKVVNNPEVQRLAKEAGRSFLTFAVSNVPKLLAAL